MQRTAPLKTVLAVLTLGLSALAAAEEPPVASQEAAIIAAAEAADAAHGADPAEAEAAPVEAEPAALDSAEVAAAEAAVAEPAIVEPAVAEPGATEAVATEATVADSAAAKEPAQAASKPLDNELEDVKKALVKLKRDLVILEEDLLFPASSQVAVFLSMDLGEFFALDSVTVKLNGKEVTSHLYTDREVDALYRGGVQKLYVGNVKQGSNRLTAFFTGRGPQGRDYRRAATVDFEKSFEPTFVELAISDSTAKYQPEFRADVSN